MVRINNWKLEQVDRSLNAWVHVKENGEVTIFLDDTNPEIWGVAVSKKPFGRIKRQRSFRGRNSKSRATEFAQTYIRNHPDGVK